MSRNQQTAPGVWPVLHCDDTERALRFLVDALGFSSGLVARDEAGAIVDAVHARAERAGAETVERPHVTWFGSGAETRACTVCDPEGNLWTFGTYDGTA